MRCMSTDAAPVAKLVPTKSDADIAADLKAQITAAMVPVLAIFDEAAKHGLLIQWDQINPGPPYFRHDIRGLRVVKQF